MSAQDPGGISTSTPTVGEGGTIEVEVTNGAKELEVFVHGGSSTTTVPVPKDGKVSIPVPTNARSGAIVTVMDMNVPPSFVTIEVISSG
jgi:hypothetical protein